MLLMYISFLLLTSACVGIASSSSPLLLGLHDILSGAYPGLGDAQIEAALAKGLKQAAVEEEVDWDDVACARDYSGNCPSGWTENPGGDCTAPASHESGGTTTIDFRGISPQEKRAVASEHDAVYDCLAVLCVQDFTALCPAGWRLYGNVCLAPDDYDGICIGRKDFTVAGIADRRAWGETCSVRWPCRLQLEEYMQMDQLHSPSLSITCPTSFAEDCPARWTKDGKYCVSPTISAMAPRCGYRVDLSRLSPRQKQAWSVVCGEAWPRSCGD